MRLAVILAFLVACDKNTGVDSPAEATPAAPPAAEPTPAEAPPGEPAIAGGWTAPGAVDADAIAAFDKALPLVRKYVGDDSLKVVQIKTHALQVVAGLNHEWLVDLEGQDGAKTYQVVAYEDLQKHWSITSVTPQ